MNQEKADYRNFAEVDFITDPGFQDWILRPSVKGDEFWKKFQADNPDKESDIVKARALLMDLLFKEDLPDDAMVDRRYLEHLEQIKTETQKAGFTTKRKFLSIATKVAAVLTGLLLAGYLLFVRTNGISDSWATEYGEQKKLYLPDSSYVVLNSKSSLTIKDWETDGPREIWLKGEAYFDVRHINTGKSDLKNPQHFIVHTKDLDVEVLGTAFNVRQRREKTEVVLQRGAIVLKTKASTLLMHPGDIVIYESSNNRLNKSTALPGEYVRWQEKKLMLNEPTLLEICNYLEDNFGKRILFEDSSMKSKKIEGPILINNLEDALFVISTVLNTKIVEQDSVLIIRRR